MIEVQKVLNAVRTLVEPVLEDMDKELVHVEYLREQGGWVLRLYVDKMGSMGITLDELARVNREVGVLLDVEDIISGSYRLEVSSPGLDRPLGKIEDCDRFAGKSAFVVTREFVDGKRRFRGILQGAVDGSLVVEEKDGSIHKIPWGVVKKANLQGELIGGEK